MSPVLFKIFDHCQKHYEQVDNNNIIGLICTCGICSGLWFLKYNSRFCNENTNMHLKQMEKKIYLKWFDFQLKNQIR